MSAPEGLRNLVARFEANRTTYLSSGYGEASVRQDFIDPLFRLLGWDVGNTAGLAEHLRDVVVELRLDVEGSKKAPDYAFRVGGLNKFFVEAKKPSIKLATSSQPALQIRRYGWNARIAYGVICDFHEFALYDTRIQPVEGDLPRTARLNYLTYDQYVEQWPWLVERFSREAVLAGSLDKIAAKERAKAKKQPVDEVFLTQIEAWRQTLAEEVVRRNPWVTDVELSSVVQLLLDRILFLRISEDREIEPESRLLELAKPAGVYTRLLDAFDAADARYNSGLFHLRTEKGRASTLDEVSPRLQLGDAVLREIVTGLYWPRSPFNFRMLGTQVLGNVYEQFLGRIITRQGDRVSVVEKPEVKKAGGVVYTPELVVDYMLDKTLDVLLRRASLAGVRGDGRGRDAHPLRVVDPACGSGSFLIQVYQRLLDWFLEQYAADPQRWGKGRASTIFETESGWALTTAERKRVLTAHVFGVDLDPQAVEVAKLSLLLKVLENESAETVDQQLALLHERALPDLDANVRCGNSLIDHRYFGLDPNLTDDEVRTRRINPFEWGDAFPAIFAGAAAGFDLVIGNPPYVLLQDAFRDDVSLAYFRQHYQVAEFKVDTYHLFIERSAELTRPGGMCSLITPSNFLTNNHLAQLRRLLLDQLRLHEIAVLDASVFRKRSVDCAIYVAEKNGTTEDFTLRNLVPTVGGSVLRVTAETTLSRGDVARTEGLLLTGGATADVTGWLATVAHQPLRLGAIAVVNFGKQLRSRAESPADVLQLGRIEEVPDSYRPCYTGRDVTRWSVDWSGLACLDDDEARRGGCWDATAQNAVGKLLCRQVGFFPDFALDERGFQCLNTMFMVNPRSGTDPLYLLGILNSVVIRAYWLDRYWDRRRTFPKIKGTYLKELPIPASGDAEVARAAADAIKHARALSASVAAGQAHHLGALLAAEKRLDTRVAQLFGLSPTSVESLHQFVTEMVPKPKGG